MRLHTFKEVAPFVPWAKPASKPQNRVRPSAPDRLRGAGPQGSRLAAHGRAALRPTAVSGLRAAAGRLSPAPIIASFVLAFSLPLALAQSAPVVAPGTLIKVELEKKIDSKKARVGDPVVAKVEQDIKSGGTVLIPKNSLLAGTVTTVAASQDHSPGKVGVLFRQITDKKGKVLLQLRAAIVAVPASYGNEYGMLTRPAEMGGNGTPPPMQGGNGGGSDLSSNGMPLQFSVMESFNGSGTDLGGVIVCAQSNFNLDEGTKVQVRVLQ